MKISVRNHSNKRRSTESMDDLKEYADHVASELGISGDIREIRLFYRKRYYGYYGKKGPFQGFKLLWHKGVVTIIFAGYYDRFQEIRKDFIVHELTHVRQLISGDMRPVGKRIKWMGEYNETWKAFRFKTMEKLPSEKAVERYLEKHFPWEIEVGENCKKFRQLRRRLKKGAA